MEIRPRLFSYPVLADFTDDFKNCEFNVLNFFDRGHLDEISLDIKLECTSEGLRNLVDTDRAAYLVHVECPATHYRAYMSSVRPQMTLNIPKKDIREMAEACTLIVATADFDYSLQEFNDDYSGLTFKISAGDILAVGKSEQIDLDYDMEAFLPSIIQLNPSNKEAGQYSVDLMNDKIVISIDQSMMKSYNMLKKSSNYLHAVTTMLAMPAIVEAVEKILADDPNSDSSERRWFKVINKKIDALNLRGQNSSTIIANHLINKELAAGLAALSNENEG